METDLLQNETRLFDILCHPNALRLGFGDVKRNGGVDHQIAPAKRVLIHGKKGAVKAVFGWPAIHTRIGGGERKDPQPSVENLFLDCGAKNKKEVEAHSGLNFESEDFFAIAKAYPFGIKKGQIGDIVILNEWPKAGTIDTVTLYVGPSGQVEYYDAIMGLSPRRIIFNPGTENYEFAKMANQSGIEVEESCTLVMLGVGNY